MLSNVSYVLIFIGKTHILNVKIYVEETDKHNLTLQYDFSPIFTQLTVGRDTSYVITIRRSNRQCRKVLVIT